jgi:hypothetical protein
MQKTPWVELGLDQRELDQEAIQWMLVVQAID